MNLRLRGWQGIAEGGECITLCVVELFQQIVACAHRHFQTLCVPERLESIQEGIRNKDCADQVGRAARDQYRSRLPRESYSPRTNIPGQETARR